MRSALLKIALCLAVCAAARAQVNPHTQIRWPTNCAGDPKMAYNWQNNTCVQAGPVGNSGEVQINQAGAWYSTSALAYNFATNTLSIPNIVVSGNSAITIPPTQMTWPTGCTASNYVSYNPTSNACFDVRSNITAGTTTTLPAGSPATVTQTGTFPNYTFNFGIPAGPTGGSLSYPGVVTDGSNGLNVTANVASASVSSTSVKSNTTQSSANKVLYVGAPPYNAKCDGTTDDQSNSTNGGIGSGIQGAFTDALAGSSNPLCTAKGCQVQFPAGTCLTSTIVYKGQSFFGAGEGLTIIKGQPGIDVFQSPDSNSFTFPTAVAIHDLNIITNSSVNAAATAGGGNNTYPNRIAGTLQGTTQLSPPIVPGNVVIGTGNCAGAGFSATAGASTVSINCSTATLGYAFALVASDLVIGAPITVNGAGTSSGTYTGTISSIASGCTGAAACTLNVSPAIGTTVTNASGSVLAAQTPPWYFSAAGIAIQCSNGSACPAGPTTWNIYNVRFDQTGTNQMQNHSVGFFTQIPMYGFHFEKLLFYQLYGGYVETAPPSGAIGTSDTSSFKDVDFYHEVVPMFTYNGNNRVLTNMNFYAEYPLNAAPYFTVNKATAGLTWTINSIYSEGNFLQSGEIARFMGGLGSFHITGASIFDGSNQSPLAWVEFNSSGSYVEGELGNALKVDGNMNDFRNAALPLKTGMIIDNGHNNTFRNLFQSGTNNYQGRRFNPSQSVSQDDIGKLDGSFLLAGVSGNPYFNQSDLFTTCSDWTFTYNPSVNHTTYGSCVPDPTGTELSHRYFQSATATQIFALGSSSTVYQNMWAGSARTFGVSNNIANGGPSSIVPRTKVLVAINLQCVGAATCTAVGHTKDGTTSGNITSSPTLTFGNTWTTQTFVSDLSSTTVGDVLDFWLDTWSNAGTSYQLAWIALTPLRTDPTASSYWLPSILYSAAGTPLPACVAAIKGQQAVVSDAASLSGNYASGGSLTSEVLCNGTNWIVTSGTSSSIPDVNVSVPSFAVPANTCYGSSGSTTPATFTMTGVVSGIQIVPGFNGNPSAINGWGSAGGLNIATWVSGTNQGSYVVCNPTTASITGGAITFIMGAK